jgi:hypothetical protein
VFLPDPRAHAARKIEICAQHGIVGRTPLNEHIQRTAGMSDEAFARAIFRKDLAMMVPSDGEDRAFDALDVFARCVAAAARTVIADRTSGQRP